MGLSGTERLVDVACGPALLAIGFRPFVASATGVDLEAQMLAAGRAGAAEAGLTIELRHGRFEEIGESLGTMDVVTIGRALHWLPRKTTLAVLERLVAANGKIAICGSLTSDDAINRWAETFHRIRRAFSSDPHERRYRLRAEVWFAGSRFGKVGQVGVRLRHRVTLADLIGRALTLSTTSPAQLGRRRADFERALREGLRPYAPDGVLIEEIRAGAEIFQ